MVTMSGSQSSGAGRASEGLLRSSGPGGKGLAPLPSERCPLGDPVPRPPALTPHACEPPGGKAGKATRGILASLRHPGALLCSGTPCREGQGLSHSSPGPAVPSSWGCGEKGPDGAVGPIWATPLPSELCLQLQEGQSKKRGQAEWKLVRTQTPEAKGVAGR